LVEREIAEVTEFLILSSLGKSSLLRSLGCLLLRIEDSPTAMPALRNQSDVTFAHRRAGVLQGESSSFAEATEDREE
jgi:hypothetical protein